MEAPPAKLIGDDSSRRKDKDKGKKKKGKAKDEGKMKMDKKKTKTKKKKKDKTNNRSLPAGNQLTSHPPLMRGSSSEGEHADGNHTRAALPIDISSHFPHQFCLQRERNDLSVCPRA
jgi:hypothetical protein